MFAATSRAMLATPRNTQYKKQYNLKNQKKVGIDTLPHVGY